MPQKHPIIIVGGNSLVGRYLMQRLVERGYTAEVISRRPIAVPEGFTLTCMDLTQVRNWIVPEDSIILSLLPLSTFTQMLPRFMGASAIIALGSTSRFSKALSFDKYERKLAASLEQAESIIAEWAERSNVRWTLLRTTLIYDCVNDKNVVRMAQFIRRWHMLPVAAPALGLRQPIHADDVALGMTACIENNHVQNASFNLAGGEILSYRSMAERIFDALHMPQRFLMLPTHFLMKGVEWLLKVGLLHEETLGSSFFRHMNQDLIYDVEEGLRVLSLKPRKFIPKF